MNDVLENPWSELNAKIYSLWRYVSELQAKAILGQYGENIAKNQGSLDLLSGAAKGLEWAVKNPNSTNLDVNIKVVKSVFERL